MKILNLPQLRQTYNYDCGAKALQSVLAYYGIELREDFIIKCTKTSKSGTSIKNIIKTVEEYGLKTKFGEIKIEDIKKFIDKKIPVILALQAWSKGKIDWEKDWSDGHYVVAIGYDRNKIIFEDPALFQRAYLKYDELEKRWHDLDADGKKYLHYGIAVFGKTPKFNSKKIRHMD